MVTYKIGGKHDDRALKEAKQGILSLGKAASDVSTILKTVAGFKAVQMGMEGINAAYEEYIVKAKIGIQQTNAFSNAQLQTATSLKRVKEFTDALSDASIFDDDDLNDVSRYLAQLDLTESQIKDIIQTASNMESGGFGELKSNAEALAKLLTTGTSPALEKQFSQIRALTDEQNKNGVGLDILMKKYDGYNEKMAEGVGAQAKMKNAVGDFYAELGKTIDIGANPIFKFVSAVASKWTDALENFNKYNEAVKNPENKELQLFKMKVDSAELSKILAATLNTMKSQMGIMPGETIDPKTLAAINNNPEVVRLNNEIRDLNEKIRGLSAVIRREAEQQDKDQKQAEQDKSDADYKALVDYQLKVLPTLSQASTAGAAYIEEMRAMEKDYFQQIQNTFNDFPVRVSNAIQTSSFSIDQITLLDRISIHLEAIKGGIDSFSSGFMSNFSDKKSGTEVASMAGDQLFASVTEKAGTAGEMMQYVAQAGGPLGLVLWALSKILEGLFLVLQSALDAILNPLVGFLRIMGMTLGQVLLPVLDILGTVLMTVLKGFITLHNYAIVPMSNGIISVIVGLQNAIAGFWNAVRKVARYFGISMDKMDKVDYDDYKIDTISLDDLKDNGATTTTAGTTSTYSGKQEINIYFQTGTLVASDTEAEKRIALHWYNLAQSEIDLGR